MKNQGISILLIEDDDVDAMNVKRAFKKINITNPLYHAEDGMQALHMLRGTDGHARIAPTPKIILLDINMPRMNGIEFLRELRRDTTLRSTSVVVLTTSNEDRDKVDAYDLNVAGYILKPVESERFVSAMSTLDLYWTLIEMP